MPFFFNAIFVQTALDHNFYAVYLKFMLLPLKRHNLIMLFFSFAVVNKFFFFFF